MTEHNPADVKVTQADKELALLIFRNGEVSWATKAIARHRIAALQQSRSAVGMMYETLTYVSEASVCEQSRKAAAETLAKVEAALSQESADA